ncbi:glycosyltransferase family 2 protein [Campylobacter lari]|nr:glycosyltransferase family 2 protein [Campylobacter lari]
MNQISIILPTYNVEKYITRALESYINQTFKDIEIIVVDDCGNDKSIEIAKEYASKDDRIKIIHNEENLGTFASRNIGVLNSSSLYIMFLDPDDYLELNACEVAFNTMVENKVDMVIFDFLYSKNNKIFKKNYLKDQSFTVKEYCKYALSRNPPYLGWNLCSKIFTKECYINALLMVRNPKKHLTMAEDALMYFFIIISINTMATSSKNIYYYCVNPYSSTQTNDINKIKRYIEDEKYIINEINFFIKNTEKNLYYFCVILMQNITYGTLIRKEYYLKQKHKILWKIFFKFILKLQKRYYKIKEKMIEFLNT